MFKRGSIAWIIWNALEAILLIVAGILCMAWSGNQDFQKTAVLIAGIMIIVEASLRLLLGVIQIFSAGELTVVRTNTALAVAGAAELALGISLCYIANNYEPTIVNGTLISGGKAVFGYAGIYLGIMLIVLASICIIHAIIYIIKKANNGLFNITIILAGALLLIAGIVCLLNLNPEKGDNVVQFFLVIMGLIALFSGIFLAVFVCVAIFAARKLKQFEDVINGTNNNSNTDVIENTVIDNDQEENK